MRRLLLTGLLLLAPLVGCGGDAAPATGPTATYDPYGTSFTPEGAVPVRAALAEPEAYVGQEVKLEGVVQEVCQMKGCWLTLDAGAGAYVRVHVARTDSGDYAFTVPKEISGRRVVVQGLLEQQTLTADEQRHLAEDAGAAPDSAAVVPQPEYQITASGVLVEKVRM